MNTLIPDINELRKKSDELTIKADTENLELAIKYVAEHLNNLSVEQLKTRILSIERKHKNPLSKLNKSTKADLLNHFENAGYRVKWCEAYIGGQFDYDIEEYLDVSW